MIHALIAAIFCCFVGLFDAPAVTCLLPAAWYLGREFAQAEHRYIVAFCGGKRANMPWYSGFLPQAWTAKGLLDWLLPCAVCLVLLGVCRLMAQC